MLSLHKFYSNLFSYLALIPLSLAHASDTDIYNYRIGLVLSGGGARGLAHIGVLKELEKMRIPIHAIAGTSMGALIGGIYASGVPLLKMEQLILEMNWNEMFTDDPPRSVWPMPRKLAAERPTWDFTIGLRDGEFRLPKGAISGQKIQLLFAKLVQHTENLDDYDAMPIPFRVVATNLETGQLKVFDRGPLATALLASMSVPGLFAPLEQTDGLYVDGGLVRNLPIDIVRKMNVNVVIAVNLGGSYLKRERLNNIFGITGQMITILMEQNVQKSLAELNLQRDVLITPELGDIESTQFERGKDTIPIGERAVQKVAAQLRRYQMNIATYANWHSTRLYQNRTAPIYIKSVRIAGLENVNPKIFKQLQYNHTHSLLNRQSLEQDVQAVYSSGDFERIAYQIQHTKEGNILVIEAIEKSWGPGYLSFGLELMHDHQGDSRFGLRSTYRQTWLNNLNAEWTTDLTIGNTPHLHTALKQPWSIHEPGFIRPYLDFGITPMHIYHNNQRLARYDIHAVELGTEIGTTWGTDWEWRLGPYWKKRQFNLDTGSPIWPVGTIRDSGLKTHVIFDTLDSGYVPHHGQRWVVEYQYPMEIVDGLESYQRVYASWQGAYPVGTGSVMGILRGGSSLGTNIPYYDQFSLGGFLNLTGYASEQFRGRKMLYASLTYHQLLTVLPSPLGRGLYLGGSLEAGRLWNEDWFLTAFSGIPTLSDANKPLYSASLFLGADTSLGPIYLGIGWSATGSQGLYVLLGKNTW